ncbi:MAG: phosphate regulon transcriptional regulator PhoB [Cellvibrionales bacterium]|nr:phosphate regulon transcriptional regulator PhoB [Cellvibrionales bacterium]
MPRTTGPSKTVLVVEDEAAIRAMLRVALEIADYGCIEAKDAYEAQAVLADALPDLVLLDWMLPEVSGIELLRRWRRRAETHDLPVIMLTAKAEEESMIRGLEAGADDYVPKPFSPRELLARIKTILRRVDAAPAEAPISLGGLVMDPAARAVTIGGQLLGLGPTEYRLLEFFLTHQGRAYTRGQLLDNVWGGKVRIDERTIDVHIRRLRKALAPHGYADCVQTVRGYGYRFGRDSSAA